MAWKIDIAPLKGRKIMTSHPLDRNRLQIHEMEGTGKRKAGVWWIEWEAKVAGLKVLQAVKVRKYIHRVTHLLGQLDLKSREGLGDMQPCGLRKVEYSSRFFKVNCSEFGRVASDDCSHEWLYKLAKTAGQS